MDCLFCKIVAGDIPSKKIHETDDLIVIEDINPQAPVHLLIISKEHFLNLNDCEDPALMGKYLAAASTVAKKLRIAESGFRTVINTNAEGGQVVYHLHIHVMGGRQLKGQMG